MKLGKKLMKKVITVALAAAMGIAVLPAKAVRADDFNVFAYANRYEDLQKAFGWDLDSYVNHWNNKGQSEGRDGGNYDGDDSRNTEFEFATEDSVYDGVDYAPVFNPTYYLNTYNDLSKAYGNDYEQAFRHFLRSGMKEGRRGNADFNVYAYANRYPDLQKAFGADLVKYYKHYCTRGIKEQRDGTGKDTSLNFVSAPAASSSAAVSSGSAYVSDGVDYSPVFDGATYIANYPDLQKAYGNDYGQAFRHFLRSGMREGRTAKSSFNVYAYANRYPDLQKAFGTDLAKYYKHYCTRGIRESRNGAPAADVDTTKLSFVNAPAATAGMAPTTVTSNGDVDYSRVFDAEYYLNRYSDLRRAFGNDANRALRHWLTSGLYEGRRASADFNPITYVNNSPDLQKAFGDDYPAYIDHYCTRGYKEGRPHNGDDSQYIAGLADIKYADMDAIANQYTSSTGYLVLTDTNSNPRVCVYRGHQGAWTPVMRSQATVGSPGHETPTGVTAIQYKLVYFDVGERLWYATNFKSNCYFFHSVKYESDDAPRKITDGRLGMHLSHGCIRLPLRKCKYIYDNVPIGSTSAIY